MILINDTDQDLIIRLEAAATTTNPQYTAVWQKNVAGDNYPRQYAIQGNLNGTTDVKLIDRTKLNRGELGKLVSLYVCNIDSDCIDLEILKKEDTTEYLIFNQELGVNYTLQYHEDVGFDIL